MSKKNHTLRHFIIRTVAWSAIMWVLILLGTILTGSFNAEADVKVVPVAVNWFRELRTYLDAIFVVKEPLLWNFNVLYADIVWYAGIVFSALGFFITFFVACKKKKAKYIFASILNLVFCALVLYAYLGLFYSNYFDPNTGLDVGLFVREFAKLLLFRETGYHFAWGIYAWGMVVSILFTIFGIFGIGVTILARLSKKEKVAVATDVVSTPIQATVNTDEETVAPVEPKKKGVLILKRYNKYGQNGPVFESEDNTYPHETIVQKPLTQEEIRSVIRDEFERREALKLAEQYKEEKNAQLIAEAIVKATNSNRNVEQEVKADETAACSFKDEEEEKVIYPSPIVFAMPADTAEEFKTKPTPRRAETVKTSPSKPKLTEERIQAIIAEEIAKALKDFVITKETVIQKPVEVKLPEKVETEETVVNEEITPVETSEKVEVVETNEPVETTETKVETEEPIVIDETIIDAPEVEETIMDSAPVEETVVEEAPIETPEVIEEAPVQEETKVEEPVAEPIPSDIPLTSNGTPKIIRIPFTVRMESADQGLREAYNHLKSLLKSYGLNNRVSNSGDTFRLHRVTYCKITIAGKSLKLYLALNPADYVDTTYPIKDASSKAIYKETPLVFKVKSSLSLRRAEELIRDCMDKHSLEQVKQLETRDWATDLNSVEFENDDFEDDDEE